MPDWLLQLVGPALSGGVAGLMLVAGLRGEVRALRDVVAEIASTTRRAHERIDDHIDRHHVRVRAGQ